MDSKDISRRNVAAKEYAYKLSPQLKKRYGLRAQYSLGQIKTTIKDFKFNDRFIAYAVALFRYAIDEEIEKELNIDQALLDLFRNEMKELFFENKHDYKTSDVLNLKEFVSWNTSYPGAGY